MRALDCETAIGYKKIKKQLTAIIKTTHKIKMHILQKEMDGRKKWMSAQTGKGKKEKKKKKELNREFNRSFFKMLQHQSINQSSKPTHLGEIEQRPT